MLKPIDIITSKNVPSGVVSDPDEASAKGLWHRGVHIIVCNADGSLLVQKRSMDSLTHPGQLEVSAGGFVDHSETPEQAAVRELREETGLVVPESRLRFLGKTKYNHGWKLGDKRRFSRVFIYTYACYLDEPDLNHAIRPQRSEVEWARFISRPTVSRLVSEHRVKGLGRLLPTYSYYRKIFAAATGDTTYLK